MEHIADLLHRARDGKPNPFTVKAFLAQPKDMMALYPLFGMVSIGFGLAGMTAVRFLAVSPAVIVDKKKRASDELPELKDPQGTAEKGKVYVETSPFCKVVKGTKLGAAIARSQYIPPVLPGDESSAIGFQGTYMNRGHRGGGI